MPGANSGGAYNDTILQSLFLDKGLKNTLSKRGTANISKAYKADFDSLVHLLIYRAIAFKIWQKYFYYNKELPCIYST